jgi:hypothetical protein
VGPCPIQIPCQKDADKRDDEVPAAIQSLHSVRKQGKNREGEKREFPSSPKTWQRGKHRGSGSRENKAGLAKEAAEAKKPLRKPRERGFKWIQGP